MADRIGLTKSNVVLDKSFRFAVKCVKALPRLDHYRHSEVVARQFLRSATSIGANLAEAQDAQSKSDFLSKCSIALKEAREADYWLRLMGETNLINEVDGSSLLGDCDELISILVAIVKSSKGGD